MLARDLRGLRPVMAKEDHINWDETRALQSSSQVIEANYAKLVRWGAYNIVKVMGRDDKPTVAASQRAPVRGYLTLLTAISGRTPLEMRDLLGLRTLDLRHGALVTRRSPADIQEARAALRQTASDCQSLFQCSERELPHA